MTTPSSQSSRHAACNVNDKPLIQLIRSEDLYAKAQSISIMVAVLRRAQGKQNPTDFSVGTPEWNVATEQFAQDLLAFVSKAWDTSEILGEFDSSDQENELDIDAAGRRQPR